MNQANSFLGRWYFNVNLLVRILLALGIGAVVGILVGMRGGESVSTFVDIITPFGTVLVRLLKMIVVPVIFFSLVVGASSVHPKKLGRVGLKIFFFYICTSAAAVSIGLFIGNLFKPGLGLNLGSGSGVAKAVEQPKLIDTLLKIIPTNPFQSLANGDVLPIIFFALIFGIGIATLRNSKQENLQKSGTIVFHFFEGAAEILYRIVHWILEYAPIGVFALIAVVFAKQGPAAFGPLIKTTLCVYCALLIHFFIVYGGTMTLFKLNFLTFLKNIKEAMVTAYITRTSSGTLPVSMKNAEENVGVRRSIYSFTLPLGATINMDGTAIYLGVCSLFISFAIGMPLTISQQILVVVTAVLASIGTAGVPGAGAIMLIMVLNSVGLKLDSGTPTALAYAMILGIDAILDMGRTWLNVTGDLTGTTIVAKSENELDESIFNS